MLSGAGGADVLLGLGGPDILYGDSRVLPIGNDTLNGGDGNDILFGGNGADTLTGGADADTFIWSSTDQSAGVVFPLGIDVANTDVILDFNPAEGDKIDVHRVDANETIFGNQDWRLRRYGAGDVRLRWNRYLPLVQHERYFGLRVRHQARRALHAGSVLV